MTPRRTALRLSSPRSWARLGVLAGLAAALVVSTAGFATATDPARTTPPPPVSAPRW